MVKKLNRKFGELWWKHSNNGDIDDFSKLPILGKIGYIGWIKTLRVITGLTPEEILELSDKIHE